jgi:hypothetical protein
MQVIRYLEYLQQEKKLLREIDLILLRSKTPKSELQVDGGCSCVNEK